MNLDLIHARGLFCVAQELLEVVHQEIAHADGAGGRSPLICSSARQESRRLSGTGQ